MNNKEITCSHLWKKWEKNDLYLYQVLQVQYRIKNYTKNDWKEMTEDARRVINEISSLIEENVDIKDQRSKIAFEGLLNHIEKYFFSPNKDYIDRLQNGLLLDEDYKKFFDKFKIGMAEKVFHLTKAYSDGHWSARPIDKN